MHIFKLAEKSVILERLYRDCVRYVEEISLIEEECIWQNVEVYVDNLNFESFLVLREHEGISAYMTAEDPSYIQEFADVLKAKGESQIHLQTSAEVKPYIKRFLGGLSKTYTVRYGRADMHTFRPHCLHKKRAVRLTPDNVKDLEPSASSCFIARIRTSPVYCYVDKNGRSVGISGVGFLTKRSFAISFTETIPRYRGQGIAKCLTSMASQPLIKMGRIGVYSADVQNEPSTRVAKALGFLPYMDLKCFHN